MEVFILSFSGDIWNNKRRIFGEEKEFLYISSVFLYLKLDGWLKLVVAYDELIVYTRGVSNDYGWVAHTIRDIGAMESHFKKEARRK